MSCAIVSLQHSRASNRCRGSMPEFCHCAALQVRNAALPDAPAHIARILLHGDGSLRGAATGSSNPQDQRRRVLLSPQLALNLGLHCHLAPFLRPQQVSPNWPCLASDNHHLLSECPIALPTACPKSRSCSARLRERTARELPWIHPMLVASHAAA